MANKSAVKSEEAAYHDIDFFTGDKKVLLVAPYGHKDDDENIGELTRRMAENSGCYALINKAYRRPKPTEIETPEGKKKSKEDPDKAQKVIDLCNVKQVENYLKEEFLTHLLKYKDEISKKHDHALIVWIQGADDEDFKKEIKETEDAKPEDFKVLVGWGQRPQKNGDTKQDDTLTAKKETVDYLVEALNINDLDPFLSCTNVDTKRYRGWVPNNMNQLYLDGKYRDQKVQSIQLEIRKNGCLKEEGLESTAKNLSEAIKYVTDQMSPENSLMHDSTDELVEKVFEHLKSVYSKKISDDMLEAGKFIIENLYDNNYKEAKGKNHNRTKSMARLIRKIQDDTEGNCPSRTWIYNSVNLAIDNYLHEKNELPAEYESLGHSHKIKLLYVENDKVKEKLIKETAEKKYTVAKLLERIKEEKNNDVIPVDKEIPEDTLKSLKSEEIQKLKEKIEKYKKAIEKNLSTCESNLAKVKNYISENEKMGQEDKKKAA